MEIFFFADAIRIHAKWRKKTERKDYQHVENVVFRTFGVLARGKSETLKMCDC